MPLPYCLQGVGIVNKSLYGRLALTNIKKNRETYYPYTLASVLIIMMYYILHSISINPGLDVMSGGSQLKEILSFGTWVVAIFSVVFLFYTNSFLIKRRKKELGLYNILGMEKKHIGRMIILETLIISLISLALGLLSGILMGKLMFLIMLKLLNFPVNLSFGISIPSIFITLILFGAIFGSALIYNLRQIHLSNPIELIRGGQVGESEPKAKWVLVVIGVLSLGVGYYIALTTESPLDAFNIFFIAVILVIVGTYSLFTAGTIALLKTLRKNKKYYYKTKHFISVSGMIYRMKQNAVGLANICILSTAVLVTISTTVCLYAGYDDIINNRFPRDISIYKNNVTEQSLSDITQIIGQETEKHDVSLENRIIYESKMYSATGQDWEYTINKEMTGFYNHSTAIEFVPLNEYNKGENQSAKLDDGEILLFTPSSGKGKNPEIIKINGRTFYVKDNLHNLFSQEKGNEDAMNTFAIVVKDTNVIWTLINNGIEGNMDYSTEFDVQGNDDEIVSFSTALNKRIKSEIQDSSFESKQLSTESFYSTFGGLLFIGVFLGTIFLIATALIIYYKQVSEGYQDRERFNIMQQVGMGKKEVKESISGQILLLFFLPLGIAIMHIAFAFKVISRLLLLFSMSNTQLFIICTIITTLIFTVIYTLVYIFTARAYYRIVK